VRSLDIPSPRGEGLEIVRERREIEKERGSGRESEDILPQPHMSTHPKRILTPQHKNPPREEPVYLHCDNTTEPLYTYSLSPTHRSTHTLPHPLPQENRHERIKEFTVNL
jgi:hypothetical protein